jgi:hypothetical protein
MPCRSASKVPANGANGYVTPELSLLTTYGSLAIDDDRYVSNEIGCLAHEYHDVFTIPCANFFSCYFAPSQTCEPNLDNARPRSCSDDSWRCLCSHHLFETFI